MINIFDFHYSEKYYFGTYVLQSLQGHSRGIYSLILLLKILRDSESFNYFGKTFGAKK